MRTITYAIEDSTGFVASRVGNEIAFPILDYEGMTPENNFATLYALEKMSVISVASWISDLQWTRKIPVEIKNLHRAFWGMPAL